jgi:hypothetical protein
MSSDRLSRSALSVLKIQVKELIFFACPMKYTSSVILGTVAYRLRKQLRSQL